MTTSFSGRIYIANQVHVMSVNQQVNSTVFCVVTLCNPYSEMFQRGISPSSSRLKCTPSRELRKQAANPEKRILYTHCGENLK
jgi:hypothetical protein